MKRLWTRIRRMDPTTALALVFSGGCFVLVAFLPHIF